ncbi:hypothetical protein U3653_16510 [Nocardia sp. CDC186]|uniref:Uncharacterized protein n=1 Tax=Nocardia implantans TaxID=3108168 RepID=A0ABU6AVW4_9NOCA|nr:MULTISPECIES: hypothetical protein [unclassified Nocardia]MBF6192996.1 hypothetical protein [Nocardia beijingensis]MEA3532425.1 hypothetical protein [Nocardia sp. CDC192]MEB3511632.1 hypothetical protein [Nocardia sp. CDC186]
MFAPAPLGDPHVAALAEAAFGAAPGRAAGDLPPASDALGRWYRAVVLGGQGRYAAARAELRRVCNHSTDPVLLSLAGSAEGSFLRQLGWHERAAAFDGRAAALILTAGAGAEPHTAESPVDAAAGYLPGRGDAICDALTGLAADALGTGRLALAARLLRRSAWAALEHRAGWRPEIRLRWVSAETALATGDFEAAAAHAGAALELAERSPSVRHRIKSRLLVAAADLAGDARGRSGVSADEVAEQCREHGLLPLRWACAMLRAGSGARDAAAEAAECAAIIARSGGVLRPMPGW